MPHLRRWFALAPAVLGALLAVAGPAAAQPSPSPDAIHRQTEEVFKRPEFQPSSSASRTWLIRQIMAVLQWLGNLSEAAPFLFWVILIGGVLLLIALIVSIVVRIQLGFEGGDRTGNVSAERAQRVRLSARYRAEADRRAEAGDYTEAIRFLFLSLVYRFDERGRVSFHKEYTNREYLEFMRDRATVKDVLQLFVDILDEHWYGQRPCRQHQYETCLAAYERLAA